MNNAAHLPEDRVFLPGPAGRLEALLRPSDHDPPRGAVLMCHPHPQHGGTMANKILYRIAKRLPTEAGMPVLRFNFRGTGQSEGRFDDGRGEAADAQAALDWLAARYPGTDLVVIGYSFGAAVGLRAAELDHRVKRGVGLGLPLGLDLDMSYLQGNRLALLFVHGENDEFADGQLLQTFASRLPGDVQTHLVPGGDHLFTGGEDQAVEAVVRYLCDATRQTR